MESKGLTAAYLKRKCKQAVPGWRIGPIPEKKAFSPEQKRERLKYAKDNVDQPPEYWQSMVFGDEHTFYRRPTPLPAVHIAGRRHPWRVNRDPRLRHWRSKHPKLHFFYAVHWKLGVLGPYWISDSTGWRRRRKYKVS